MKLRMLLMSVMLGLSFTSTSSAQNQPDLDKLDEKFQRYFERIMPGWKHERVEPVYKDENVLIQFWSAPSRKVKISIMPHKSAQKAEEVLKNSRQLNRVRLTDLGDEAFAGGYGSASISLRKGKFTIYISTYADIDSDVDARTLTQEQRFEREKSEKRRLSLEFAKHAAKAVDAP